MQKKRKKALIIVQQCYNCGRDLTRKLTSQEKAEFLEDHPEFPLGYDNDIKKYEHAIAVGLPETECDPCIESYLDWRYGPEEVIDG